MTDKKLISSLQGLRAVAFLCVVISHCGAPWLGPWAISVFVALSGFLMVCNYYDRPRTAPGLQSAIAFSLKKNTPAVSAAPYYDGCRPVICTEGASGAALCPRGSLLCGAACGKHFPVANMDPVQPFLVLPEWSGLVSFGAGFSVCHLSHASRRAEKGRCPQTALHCRSNFLRTVPFLPCGLESRAQRKGRILPDLSVSAVPGRRFYHQLLRGLSLPQPQTGEHTTAQCFLPIGAGRCTACGRLPFYRRQAGGGSGRSGLPVQCAVHSLCGAAGLAARHGQRVHFPAAIRKAVFVAGTALPLRLSDPSGTDPVYGVDCGQV